MKKNSSILFLLAFLMLMNSSYGQNPLSNLDVKRASDMVRGFMVPGNNYIPPKLNISVTVEPKEVSNDLGDPNYEPYFGNLPAVPRPLSAIEKEIDKEISKRTDRVNKIRGQREIFKVMLEKLQNAEDYNAELEDWGKESQTAQLNAVLTVFNLLGDVAGPIQEAIEMNRFNSAYIGIALSDKNLTLGKINDLLLQTGNSETKDLEEGIQILRKAIGNQVYMKEVFTDIKGLLDLIKNGAKAIEYETNISKKSSLLLAAKYTGDFITQILLDKGLKLFAKKAVKEGMLEMQAYTALGKFGINYLYNSMRFWVAWTNIDDLLVKVNQTSSSSVILAAKILQSTNMIQSVNQEIKELKEVKGDDVRSKALLEKIRAQQLYNAYIAGDYYAQKTGIYAEGQPINNQ